MLKEERVKEEFKLAVTDQKYKEDIEKVGQYYKSDYVGKEVMISFITGTVCFGLIVILFILGQMESIVETTSTMNYVSIGITLALIYLVFMILYMAATYIIYSVRYKKMRRKAIVYNARIKKLNKLYAKEENLKKN